METIKVSPMLVSTDNDSDIYIEKSRMQDKKLTENKATFWTMQKDYGNGDYCHWSEGLTMFIEKGGVTIELDGDELEDLVKALPRTMGGSY